MGRTVTLNGVEIDLENYEPPTADDYRRLETFRGHAYGERRSAQAGGNLKQKTPRKGKFSSFPVGGIRAK